MPGFAVTPQWVGTFEKNVQTLFLDSWNRVLANLVWDRFMMERPSTTLVELYTWLLETAQIHPYGVGGGQMAFDSISAVYREITNEDSGSALELTKNEIEDNMLDPKNHPGLQQAGPALDYAGQWAKQMGGASAYYPQQRMFELIADGEVGSISKAYDGQPYFGTHVVNPYDSAAGSFKNLLTGAASGTYPGACPIDDSVSLAVAIRNLAKAIAYIRTLTSPNGKKRMLRVKYASAGPDLQLRLAEILKAKFYGADGSTENMVSFYGIEPVICDELAAPGEWYLDCELINGEGGAIIWQNRSPYVMNSYTPLNTWELQRLKKFTWSFDGRNAVAWGHPWLKFKMKPS